MEHPTNPSPLPADYYRRHAARVRELARDAGTVYGVAFHPDGARLASGSADTTVLIWDLMAN